MDEFENILRADLVKFWRQDLGQLETGGKNRSPMIDAINSRLHVPMGSAYCIGGLLVRGVERLCTVHRLRNPVVMTAGSQLFYTSAPAMFKGPNKLARRGDIGILQSIATPTQGHAFGFTEDEALGKFKTIEYNTNNGGSRDGDGVYELVRSRAGTMTKKWRGSVDVVAWIISANK